MPLIPQPSPTTTNGSLADVAAFLGVSRKTVQRLVIAGELGSWKAGRQRRVSEDQLVTYVMKSKRLPRHSGPGSASFWFESAEQVSAEWREFLAGRSVVSGQSSVVAELVKRVERLEALILKEVAA